MLWISAKMLNWTTSQSIVNLWTWLYPPACCWDSLFLRPMRLCVLVVGVHSSSCGFCADIGGCHADLHGKGLSWPCTFGNTGHVFLFGLTQSQDGVHGPAACIWLLNTMVFLKTNFTAVPWGWKGWKRCIYSHISSHGIFCACHKCANSWKGTH